jgi:hypothetical protein
MEQSRRSPVVTAMAAFAIVSLLIFTVQRAFATVIVPNARKDTFTVPAASTSGPFPMGSFNTPIHVSVAVLAPALPSGVTFAELNYSNFGGGSRTAWMGYSFTGNVFARGALGNGGTAVIAVPAGGIELLVTPSPTGTPTVMRVRNNTGGAATVSVLQTW